MSDKIEVYNIYIRGVVTKTQRYSAGLRVLLTASKEFTKKDGTKGENVVSLPFTVPESTDGRFPSFDQIVEGTRLTVEGDFHRRRIKNAEGGFEWISEIAPSKISFKYNEEYPPVGVFVLGRLKKISSVKIGERYMHKVTMEVRHNPTGMREEATLADIQIWDRYPRQGPPEPEIDSRWETINGELKQESYTDKEGKVHTFYRVQAFGLLSHNPNLIYNRKL